MTLVNINYNFSSQNQNDRPNNSKINCLIIHYTEMKSAEDAIDRLCSSEAQVSAHYLISKQGEIFSLVAEEKRAWHAGVSYWRGRNAVNDFSIGIELDNNGSEEFSSELMQSLILLLTYLRDKYNIHNSNIIGHSDIAPTRKVDPGIFFPWDILYKEGIGILPQINFNRPVSERGYGRELEGDSAYRIRNALYLHEDLSTEAAYKLPAEIELQKRSNEESEQLNLAQLQQRLQKFGYGISNTGEFDDLTMATLESFCVHYLKKNYSANLLPVINMALDNLNSQMNDMNI